MLLEEADEIIHDVKTNQPDPQLRLKYPSEFVAFHIYPEAEAYT
jgi:hypothetical protein